MITHMTRRSMWKTMRDLEKQHLAKQRFDAVSILEVNLNRIARVPQNSAQANLPSCVMWRGYEHALHVYGMSAMIEHTQRYGGNSTDISKRYSSLLQKALKSGPFVAPPWFNDNDVLLSHRSSLVRRFPEIYSAVFPSAPNDMPYIWPVPDADSGGYRLRISVPDMKLIDLGERTLSEDLLVTVNEGDLRG